MGTIAADKILETGFTSTPTSCDTDGDEFRNSGIEFLKIKNNHASQAYDVTVVAQTTSVRNLDFGELTKSSIEFEVAAGNTAYMGPFKQRAFNDADEMVQMTYLTTAGAALSTVSSGVHALTVELLYLEQI